MCFGGQIASAVRGNIVSVLLCSGCVPLWQQAKKGLMIKNKASLSAICTDVKKLFIFIVIGMLTVYFYIPGRKLVVMIFNSKIE